MTHRVTPFDTTELNRNQSFRTSRVQGRASYDVDVAAERILFEDILSVIPVLRNLIPKTINIHIYLFYR